jgi:chromosome segregation ATPase
MGMNKAKRLLEARGIKLNADRSNISDVFEHLRFRAVKIQEKATSRPRTLSSQSELARLKQTLQQEIDRVPSLDAVSRLINEEKNNRCAAEQQLESKESTLNETRALLADKEADRSRLEAEKIRLTATGKEQQDAIKALTAGSKEMEASMSEQSEKVKALESEKVELQNANKKLEATTSTSLGRLRSWRLPSPSSPRKSR